MIRNNDRKPFTNHLICPNTEFPMAKHSFIAGVQFSADVNVLSLICLQTVTTLVRNLQ